MYRWNYVQVRRQIEEKSMKISDRILKFWLILKFLVIIFGQFKQLQNYPTPDFALSK